MGSRFPSECAESWLVMFSLVPLKTQQFLRSSSCISSFPQKFSEEDSGSFSFLPTRLNSVFKFVRHLRHVLRGTELRKSTVPCSLGLWSSFLPALWALSPPGHAHLHTVTIPKAKATSSELLLWQHLIPRSWIFYGFFFFCLFLPEKFHTTWGLKTRRVFVYLTSL